MPATEGKFTKHSVTLNPGTWDKLTARAEAEGISKAELIRRVLDAACDGPLPVAVPIPDEPPATEAQPIPSSASWVDEFPTMDARLSS